MTSLILGRAREVRCGHSHQRRDVHLGISTSSDNSSCLAHRRSARRRFLTWKLRPSPCKGARESGFGALTEGKAASQPQLSATEPEDFAQCAEASRRGAQCPNVFLGAAPLAIRTLDSPRDYEGGRATRVAFVPQGGNPLLPSGHGSVESPDELGKWR